MLQKSYNKKYGTQKYILENKKISSNNDVLIKNKKIQGYGEFYFDENKKSYGKIQLGDYCLEKNYLQTNPTIVKGKCQFPIYLEEIKDQVSELDSSDNLVKTENNDITMYYTGKNPNNYLVFSNACFRIMSFNQNNTVKIIYDGPVSEFKTCEYDSNTSGSVGLFTWDKIKTRIVTWDEYPTLSEIMTDWEENSVIKVGTTTIKLDLDKVEAVNWNIGLVSEIKDDISVIEQMEKSATTKGKRKLGLPNVSDYVRAGCLSNKDCAENNYLYKSAYNWWLINTASDTEKNVWIVNQKGLLENKPVKYSNEYYFSGVRPTMYLKNDNKVVGFGTAKDPYQILD